jgi:hypothetical protein
MTIEDLIKINRSIYGVGDDRLYSVDDLLYYNQKYILRFIDSAESKSEQAKSDLIVALFWYIALIFRYHIDIESELWKHYSYKCPRCMDIPCSCQGIDIDERKKTGRPPSRLPGSLSEWQAMILKIYPNDTLPDVGNKLIKYLDKLSFCFRNYIKKPNEKNLKELEYRTIDYFVLVFEAMNLMNIDLDNEISTMFKRGCYVCHKIPCICNYSE